MSTASGCGANKTRKIFIGDTAKFTMNLAQTGSDCVARPIDLTAIPTTDIKVCVKGGSTVVEKTGVDVTIEDATAGIISVFLTGTETGDNFVNNTSGVIEAEVVDNSVSPATTTTFQQQDAFLVCEAICS